MGPTFTSTGCLPVGGAPEAPWLENDILEADSDVDEMFAPYD